MSGKKETQWFIAVLDANTNEWLAKYLAENAKEVFTENLVGPDGKDYQCYRTDHATISLVNKSSGQFGFKTVFFSRYGQYGKLQKWIFEGKKKKIKIPQVKL